MSRHVRQPHLVLEQLENRMLLSAANDPFSGRAAITSLPATIVDTNVGATTEPGEPAHAGAEGGASVWWTWTAPMSGMFQITTADSSFDTLLAVYTGSSLATLQVVAAADDGGTTPGSSMVTFSVTAGTAYQIAVDGFQGATGSITLTLSAAGMQVINGTAGDDEITVSVDGTDYLVGINGTQTPYPIADVLGFQIYGGSGNDTIALAPEIVASTIDGGLGDDSIIGGNGADSIRGDGGNDTIYGGAGDDSIMGNTGDDQLFGQDGTDQIQAGLGYDWVEGGIGNDALYGGNQSDTIYGGEGDDYIEGRGKDDTVYGDAGNDTILGGAGSDLISGGDGDDRIWVGASPIFSDTVDGGDGEDLSDGDGNDVLTNIEGVLA